MLGSTYKLNSEKTPSELWVQIDSGQYGGCGHASATIMQGGQAKTHLSIAAWPSHQKAAFLGLPLPLRAYHDSSADMKAADTIVKIPLTPNEHAVIHEKMGRLSNPSKTAYSLYGTHDPVLWMMTQVVAVQNEKITRFTGREPAYQPAFNSHSCTSAVVDVIKETSVGKQLGQTSFFWPKGLGQKLSEICPSDHIETPKLSPELQAFRERQQVEEDRFASSL